MAGERYSLLSQMFIRANVNTRTTLSINGGMGVQSNPKSQFALFSLHFVFCLFFDNIGARGKMEISHIPPRHCSVGCCAHVKNENCKFDLLNDHIGSPVKT